MTTVKNQPVSVALTEFVGQSQIASKYLSGVWIVGIVPVVLLFVLIERRLVAGLIAGGVK